MTPERPRPLDDRRKFAFLFRPDFVIFACKNAQNSLERQTNRLMKHFPYEWESKREVLFYPEKRERIDGDILEIGPGRGDFLFALADKWPEKRIVGVEFFKKRHFKLIKQIERRGLTNILLVQGRAQIVIPKFFEIGVFERIYVLFPDPWPKDRHIPHRLMTSDFMATLACLLKPGGDLVVATDYRLYAEWVIENNAEVDVLENIGTPYCDSSDVPDYLPTFFEQKWRDEGRDIYYMRFRRVGDCVAMPVDRTKPKS